MTGFEGLETAAGKPHRSWTDHPANHSEGRREVDRIEVEPEAGHEVVSIGEDLSPLTIQTASTGQGSGHCELLDERVTIHADDPRSELETVNVGEHPVQPTAYSFVSVESDTEQLNGAVCCETCDHPVEICGLEGLIEFGRSLPDRSLGLHRSKAISRSLTGEIGTLEVAPGLPARVTIGS